MFSSISTHFLLFRNENVVFALKTTLNLIDLYEWENLIREKWKMSCV